ncbi:C40 family peptidase [Nocardia sp. CDC159]|uniref:C40 family peptidase n=1 Tax=Nocardia pulmonis TaxID=2951408 RepID=A0A9X2E5U3_9NOCA|nr:MULTISPECIES: NlpC/P60 family protein [Nocardia]MCM6773370.1 C40 family peptidase [Nocardia pulmonis]MCM6786257.1 C40 family peptidase [Nocardia sp. CDC159]
MFGGPVGGVGAEPVAVPNSASDAVQKLIDLSHQSEQLNQQALAAQEDLDAKQAVARDADAKLAAATAAVDAAQAEIRKYQPAVDRTAVAAYQGARTNRLFSVLVSDSPQQLLDQMSTLDVLATQTQDQLAQYKKATDAATTAQTSARTADDAARAASQKADQVRAELERKRADLQGSIAQVIQAWGSLSAGDKASLAGALFPPGFDRDTLLRGLVPGSGTSALAAGLTRVGDPYVWGATGPDQFDCSGLVQWAFRKVGIDLPRTSQAQSAVGTPVDKNDLQPGDVVFFYSDASHVGIYAGNGLILHASTFGIPVQVAPMGSTPYHSARRYWIGMP